MSSAETGREGKVPPSAPSPGNAWGAVGLSLASTLAYVLASQGVRHWIGWLAELGRKLAR